MAIVREGALVGDKELIFETGRIAKQAGGSVMVQYGDTMVLVTACDGGLRDLPFFPLTCDYIEKSYAAGRIPGGYFKREGRLGEHEVLTSRLIDRPCRPLFPEGYRNDTQIMATVLSMDQENEADVLSITGASAALMISDIPWEGPIAGVRIGLIDGEFVANPTNTQRAASKMDIVLACSLDAILMVEGQADEVDDDVMLEALDFGRAAVQEILQVQLRMREACGKAKAAVEPPKVNAEIKEAVIAEVGNRMMDVVTVLEKHARYGAIAALKKEVVAAISEKYEGDKEAINDAKDAFDSLRKRVCRTKTVNESKRIDGRDLDEVRTITNEVGILPRTHGSALFTRGETQTLVTATMGTERDNQRFETLTGSHTRNFLLHYNFPPFSVGETKPLRSPGRREIGHGTLARRALVPVIPDLEAEFPYVIRIVSETLESNGSSSMASVCGGTMALMDAGVPIKAPVAGIAMGLIKEGDDIAILSDILGDEDHYGDMDFKVCGTRDGITAFQMDTKIAGISRETMKNALAQARKGRNHILDRMLSVLDKPRAEMSPFAPRIVSIKIKPHQIGGIIGPGGRTIRGISEQTGANINIEDDGTIKIASPDELMAKKAIDMIRNLTQEAEAGKTYMGTVKKIVDFGAFIEILPGIEGLCHISELTEGRVGKVEDVLKEGEEVLVKCLAIDRSGKIKLSRKEALAEQGA
ncbi:MAG: polyribonucleotide nucleotidyltransferase [Myxococcota bacterium]